MRLSVITNAAAIVKAMREDAPKQARYAAAVAMTRTGKLATKAISDTMARVFDRPMPYTLRSPFATFATKDKLEVTVGIKDKVPSGAQLSPADVLMAEFIGGTRRQKRVEFWLQRAGLISAGEYVVPGAGARLDRYGNISRGQIQQILSQLRAGPDALAYSSKSARSKRNVKRAGVMFWSPGGRLRRGVWMRKSRGVVPILIVVSRANYRELIILPRVIEDTFKANLADQFGIAYQQAMATARSE